MKPETENETAKLWRSPHLGRIELLHASYIRHTFNKHFHEQFVLGVIERGALGFRYLGRDHVAGPRGREPGRPGETHNGFPAAGGGWQYRMFYMDPELPAKAASELWDRPPLHAALSNRRRPRDPVLAREIHALHRALERPYATRLEVEERLSAVLKRLIVEHAERKPVLRKKGKERAAVERARAYIREHFSENISLDTLSTVADLSRYHLLRCFHKEIGLPPHAYQNQVRVAEARSMLAQGFPIADAAFAAGFSDQSHLNRRFKRIHGVPPGAYRNIVQDPNGPP